MQVDLALRGWAEGQLLQGRYQPVEVVGRGGQGEVVRAVDHRCGSHVALKVRSAGTTQTRQALRSEARLLRTLRSHPGLPVVREEFFEGDRYVMVMDWIEGMSLAWLLVHLGCPGLPLGSVLRWLRQLAGTLDLIHSHSPPVVHGDLKPANLMLTPDEQVVLVDFGISGLAGSRAFQVTAGYAPPELVAGAPLSVATDVFGLAATAVALVTGTPPDGTRPHWTGVTGAQADVLERILGGALAVDPLCRPASAGALMADLYAVEAA